MDAADGISRNSDRRLLRLMTLIWLRWLAIAGQTAAILVVAYWFRFPVPVSAAFALVSMSAWLNVVLRIAFPAAKRLEPQVATALLAFDVVQLSGLLYLTGGLENPFAILLLVPVLISATALDVEKTFLLGGLVVASATLLAFVHEPLPWIPNAPLDVPLLYVGGLWLALFCALVFMAFYAFRVAEEARQLSGALMATELVLQREQHLTALDGLAAAAAHELGTPLATIVLVAKELARETASDAPHAEDILLLQSQAQRCRDILGKLTSLSARPDDHLGASLPVTHLLDDAVAPHRDFGIAIRIATAGEAPEPRTRRNPGLAYGIGNLVENAVDFARAEVALRAEWTAQTVTLVIEDDGPGFSPEVIERLGEPYVTTRRNEPGREAGREHGGGLGLGFFIARTLLERTGARVRIANRDSPASGAVVAIEWPRSAFDLRKEPGETPVLRQSVALSP